VKGPLDEYDYSAACCKATGLSFKSVLGTNVPDSELRDALITNSKGETVFEQKGVQFPKDGRRWQSTCCSKYFHGKKGSPT